MAWQSRLSAPPPRHILPQPTLAARLRSHELRGRQPHRNGLEQLLLWPSASAFTILAMSGGASRITPPSTAAGAAGTAQVPAASEAGGSNWRVRPAASRLAPLPARAAGGPGSTATARSRLRPSRRDKRHGSAGRRWWPQVPPSTACCWAACNLLGEVLPRAMRPHPLAWLPLPLIPV